VTCFRHFFARCVRAREGAGLLSNTTNKITIDSVNMNLRSLVLASAALAASGFAPASHTFGVRSSVSLAAKGFGETPKKKEISQGQADREQKSAKYDEVSAAGGQEYNIFVRQFGGEDDSWLPCGAIAVPRQAQVSDAIFANEEGLKVAIVRTYPKLGGFEEEFEFGYNLKVYSDDPVEVAVKGAPKQQGLSIGNWLSTLLSPVDASKVPPPQMKD